MIAAPARFVYRRAASPSPDPPDCPSRHRAAAPPSSGSSGQGYCGAPAGLKGRCFPVPFPQPCRRHGGLQDSPPAWLGHTRPAPAAQVLGGSVHIPPCGQQQQTQHQQDHNGIPVSFHKHLFQTVPSGAVFFCISTDCLPLYSSNSTFFRVVCRSASRASSAASSILKRQGFPRRQPCR